MAILDHSPRREKGADKPRALALHVLLSLRGAPSRGRSVGDLVVSHAFPRTLCDGLVILFLALVTGALHLDGLADTLDGMAAGKSAEERLRIMRDQRVGTFGAVGLILILGIKFLA